MKICFFGSSSFSVPSLISIRDYVTLVVTKKAKPKGRGYLIDDNEVKKCAISFGLDVVEIGSFSDEEAKKIMLSDFDLFVTVSFGLILPKEILQIPKLGAINVHPSLLPKYRGPSPIQTAILEGEKTTGITIIRMGSRVDAGNILYQEKIDIYEEDDAPSLSERLSKRSSEILCEFLKKIERNGLEEGVPQNEALATYTKPIKKEMAKIDWSESSFRIANMIRAYAGWPCAYTYLDGKLLKIHKAKVFDMASFETPGRIILVLKEGIVCSTGEGTILLCEVQLEGKRRLSAYEFAIGQRGLVGKIFS